MAISLCGNLFLDKLWPDFNEKDLKKIVKNFSTIKRNFGSI